MAKNPTNRASSQAKKNQPPTKGISWVWVIGGLALLSLAWGGWLWWQGRQAGANFDFLVAQGQDGLRRVETGTDAGRGHSNEGEDLQYTSNPPTSGVHWPTWVDAGFYTVSQPEEKLVHALEHGNVVIYYDQPGETSLNALKAWAKRFQGQWDGLVVVPQQGLGASLVLTAWNKSLRLDGFDGAAMAAFIDAYRGRGPENPVR